MPLNRSPLALALVATALVAAGCTSSTAGAGGLNPAASPGPTATASATATATATAPSSANPTTHAYPTDYPGAILAAWGAHDAAYLTLLTDAATVAQLDALGSPDMHWTAVPAQGAMGSSYAGYYNALGSMIVLRTDNAATAARQWHAGSVQSWDIMTYPGTATDYLKKFLDGWIAGNKQRMVLLSSDAIAAHFLATTAPDSSYVLGAPSGAAGSTYIQVTDAGDGLNTSFQIGNATVGQPHAIIGCTPTACG